MNYIDFVTCNIYKSGFKYTSLWTFIPCDLGEIFIVANFQMHFEVYLGFDFIINEVLFLGGPNDSISSWVQLIASYAMLMYAVIWTVFAFTHLYRVSYFRNFY